MKKKSSEKNIDLNFADSFFLYLDFNKLQFTASTIEKRK